MNAATIPESPTFAQLDENHLTIPACPKCETLIGPRVRIVVERIRKAAKRPVVPEMLHVCDCGAMYVVSLRPETGR